MKLYALDRNTASDSVRLALEFKGIGYELRPLRELAQLANYPLPREAMMGPVLQEDQRMHTQSLSIIEYLDEIYPDPTLLPGMARDRSRVRGIAQIVMSDIDPYIRASVMDYREQEGCGDAGAWAKQWIDRGFEILEAMLKDNPATGKFCLGDSVTLADICLTPLVWNAEHLGLELGRFPSVRAVYENSMRLPEFASVGLDLA